MSDLCLGTLTSITNLATSLARNMDRLSLDEEHYTRQEEWRRQLPESLGDGLRQGLSRLGISLLGTWGYMHTQTKDAFHELLFLQFAAFLIRRGGTQRNISVNVSLHIRIWLNKSIPDPATQCFTSHYQ